MFQIDKSDWNFYETILHERESSDCFVKFYADIDISKKEYEKVECSLDFNTFGETVFNALVNKFNISPTDILKFSSHGADKRSYHLILDKHAFKAKSLKSVYTYLTKDMKEEYARFVDRAPYNKTQQFRMLWNRKYGSQRVKLFEKSTNS